MPAKKPGRPTRGTDDASAEMRALFAANVRQARLKAKLTQVDVEGLTGISQHYISQIERGALNITLDTMVSLARAVGSDVRTLLKPLPKKRRAAP
jgi:transcriptional regulator with XRE-family HTH domain